jgi:hypothetical protein
MLKEVVQKDFIVDESFANHSHWRITNFSNRLGDVNLQPQVGSFRYVKTTIHLFYIRDNVKIGVEYFSLC